MCRKTLLVLLVVLWALPSSADMVVHTAWVSTYNGPGNDWDEAHAIVVDDMGNVYVAGQSMGSGTDWDYATVKYYSDGEVAWVARYDGPIGSRDIATAIAVDGSGNVYVTGHSQGLGNNADFLTVKYDPSGDTAWVRRYNGPANSTDAAFGIAVDQFGNAYVAGYSVGSESSEDYLTIKYGPDGNQLWVATYNGPGNGNDRIYAIVADDAGNAYVTGPSLGDATSSDYATIMYNPVGNEQWVARYNGEANSTDRASAIAVDGSGNACVTGWSIGISTYYDYATVKYDADGNELWARRYGADPPAGPGDYAHAMAVGGSGNVFATGWSYGSETFSDYATVKYSSDGNQLWVERFNASEHCWDAASAIALDGFGNAYVTGYTEALDGVSDDYLTVKYDLEGNQLWTSRYNGSGNSFDGASAIAVDGSDNVYVTGKASGSGTSYDYATIKYVQYDAVRGDANGDGTVESGDVVFMINYLFRGGAPPDPLPAGDSNCDGVVGSGDVVYLINYLFRGGPAPSC